MNLVKLQFCPDMCQEGDCWIIWQLYFQFFEESPYCFPWWLHQFTFYQHYRRVSFSPHLLQHLLFVDFSTDGHSDWCEVVLHCSLICISLIISSDEHLFTSLLAICVSYLEKQVFCSLMAIWFFIIELYELFAYFRN